MSAIIPSFKGEKWVGECLDTLAAQTVPWSDFEAVVVQNGPKTGTREVIETWLANHPGFQLQYFEEELPSLANARNVGIAAAAGEYLTFIDDDDRVGPRYLEGLLAKAAPDVVSIALYPWVFDDAWDQPRFIGYGCLVPMQYAGKPYTNADLAPLLHGPGAKLIHTEVARSRTLAEGLQGYGEDSHYLLGLFASHDLRFVLTDLSPEGAYLYRVREGSLFEHDSGTTWVTHVERTLRLAAAMEALDIDDPMTREMRRQALVAPYIRINEYLQEHPHEVERVRDEIERLGLVEVHWQHLFQKISCGFALVSALGEVADAHGTSDADRLLAYGLPIDVATYGATPRDGVLSAAERLAKASPVVGQHLALTGPEQVDWALFKELVGPVTDTYGKLTQSKGDYRTLLSRSAGPLEHLLAAMLKIAQPQLRWTAEHVAPVAGATVPGGGAQLSVDGILELFVTAMAMGGFSFEEVPEEMAAFARLVTLTLADEIVFSTDAQREAILDGVDPQVAERVRTHSSVLHPTTIAEGLQVSVVVPTYKGDGWLGQCLESLADQTVPHDRYEIVVVHNGPANASQRIVEETALRHPGLQVTHLHSEVAGAANARNLGLDAARGTYVTFVDDDDRVGPRFLEVHLAKASPEVVTVSALAMVQDSRFDHPTFTNWLSEGVLTAVGGDRSLAALDSSIQPAVAKFVTTEAARRVRFRDDLVIGEDTVYWLSVIAANGLRFALTEISDDALYLYDQRSGNTTSQQASWEFHAAGHIRSLKALAEVESSDPEVLSARAKLLGRFMIAPALYLRRFPDEVGRFADELRAQALPDFPWEQVGVVLPVPV